MTYQNKKGKVFGRKNSITNRVLEYIRTCENWLSLLQSANSQTHEILTESVRQINVKLGNRSTVVNLKHILTMQTDEDITVLSQQM